MFSNKAISPVVAISLMLVVGFQGWFSEFSSSLFVDVELDSSYSNSNVGIENLIGGKLYFNAGENLEIFKIEIEDTDCLIKGNFSGLSSVDVVECIQDMNVKNPEIVIYSTEKLFSEEVFLDSIPPVIYGSTFVSVGDTNKAGVSDSNQILYL